jgi:lipoprotein-releasing system permease protein
LAFSLASSYSLLKPIVGISAETRAQATEFGKFFVATALFLAASRLHPVIISYFFGVAAAGQFAMVQNLFSALVVEQTVMFWVLSIIIIVAVFNILSSLIMLVRAKTRDIAILRTFGMSGQRIMRIFMIQGSIIGVFGTLVGVGLGVWLSLNISTVIPFFESTFGFKIFSSDVFYISEIPSDMRWENVIWIGVASLIASVLATIYPAWRASQIQPAESLRYE